jgi:DNA-binding MarR family transcriptional regulator
MGLSLEEQRVWLAYMRVYLQLTYEMNHQLTRDSQLSLADYHVLSALRRAAGHRLRVSELATEIGWERTRASHQVRRMEKRGLLSTEAERGDRRAREVSATTAGREAFRKAAPGHAELVRKLFFTDLPKRSLASLASALEQVSATIDEHGVLNDNDLP